MGEGDRVTGEKSMMNKMFCFPSNMLLFVQSFQPAAPPVSFLVLTCLLVHPLVLVWYRLSVSCEVMFVSCRRVERVYSVADPVRF